MDPEDTPPAAEAPVLLGVAGAPAVVAGSLSPRMFAAAFAATGIRGFYVPLAIRERAVRKALRGIARLGFAGVNVTMPYKAVAAEVAHTRSELVERTGVANTLIVRDTGQLHAEATDGLAVTAALAAAGTELAGRTVTILGAGGAGTEAAFACASGGATGIEVWNRSPERSEALVAALREHFPDLELQVRTDLPIHVAAHVLVSAIPAAAMPPGARAMLDSGPALVVDFAYRADGTPTPVTRLAEERGTQVVDGRELLVRQAAEAFRLWLDREPPMEEMQRAVR